MNKDQLLDAIGMVDEQKIRDALMIKRTRRISGILALSVVLCTLAFFVLLFVGIRPFFGDEVAEYTAEHIVQDIDNANVVTVVPDPTDRQSYYTIYVPDGMGERLCFEEWEAVEPQGEDNRDCLLILRFHDVSLEFYDGGCVRAEKHDWDTYIGVYRVPEDLWCEVFAFLKG